MAVPQELKMPILLGCSIFKERPQRGSFSWRAAVQPEPFFSRAPSRARTQAAAGSERAGVARFPNERSDLEKIRSTVMTIKYTEG